jgi:hypothetical protein
MLLKVADGSPVELGERLERAAGVWNAIGARVVIVPSDSLETPRVVRLVPAELWIHGDHSGNADPFNGIEIDALTWQEASAYNPRADAFLMDLVLHEVGHMVGCNHVPDIGSVMNASVFYNTALSRLDVQEFEAAQRGYHLGD